MIGKLVKGAGFRGVAEYLLSGKTPAGGRRGSIIGGNMAGRTPRELAREFGVLRKMRPTLGKAVFHASLSLPPKDRVLTDAEFADIGEQYLAGMGFADSPYVIVRHDDTEHQHIHLLASRIAATTGDVVTDKHDFKRSENLIRELESAFGLIAVAPSITTTTRRNTMHPEKKKSIEARLEKSVQAAEAEISGNGVECVCAPFRPSDTERRRFKRRLLEAEYEHEIAASLADGVSYIRRSRQGLTIHTTDGGVIVDSGDRVTAKQMSGESAAVRMIAIARAKGWPAVELSGSRDFVRAAMKEALKSGLAVSPKDTEQSRMLEEVMRELGRAGGDACDLDPAPNLLQRLQARRQREQAPPASLPSSKGGRHVGF